MKLNAVQVIVGILGFIIGLFTEEIFIFIGGGFLATWGLLRTIIDLLIFRSRIK